MNDFNDLYFSDSLDRLLDFAWGEALGYCTQLPDEGISYTPEGIEAGLNKLADATRQALRYLNGPATLSLSPGMEGVVKPALHVLDSAIILGEYLATQQDAIADRLAARAQLIGFMTIADRAVPFHRLIPLNAWRRNFRDNLPESLQPLFPWYDVWSQENDLLLQEFTDMLPSLRIIDFSSFPAVDHQRLRALLDDIRHDSPFMTHLGKSHRLHWESVRAVGNDLAMRLFILAEGCNPDIALPAEILAAGFHTAAAAALKNRPNSKEAQHESLFLAAFAGPELEDEERLRIFRKVATFVENRDELEADSLLKKLQLWQKHWLLDDDLEKAVFARWTTILKKAASTVPAFSYQEGSVYDAVKRLEGASPGDKLHKFRKWFSETMQTLNHQPLSFADAPAAGRLNEDRSEVTLSIPIPEGLARLSYAHMPTNGQFLAAQEACEIRGLLDRNARLYFAAIVEDCATGNLTKISPTRLTNISSLEVAVGKTWYVGIGDKAALATAITTMQENGDRAFTPAQLDHIVWIIYDNPAQP